MKVCREREGSWGFLLDTQMSITVVEHLVTRELTSLPVEHRGGVTTSVDTREGRRAPERGPPRAGERQNRHGFLLKPVQKCRSAPLHRLPHLLCYPRPSEPIAAGSGSPLKHPCRTFRCPGAVPPPARPSVRPSLPLSLPAAGCAAAAGR